MQFAGSTTQLSDQENGWRYEFLEINWFAS
jgi:hypothetical protein